jgi:LacI family repressor for deo operon, udp, cdd, tsx, nupC, and nupG
LSDEDFEVLSLPAGKRPTAAVGFNDTFAYRLLAHCYRVGIKVPDDLAVVGFDGTFSWHERPQVLSTVYAPWEQVAETAVDRLLDRIDNVPVPMETILPVHWIDGDTL